MERPFSSLRLSTTLVAVALAVAPGLASLGGAQPAEKPATTSEPGPAHSLAEADGAAPGSGFQHGRTPLMMAVARGDLATVRSLIADPEMARIHARDGSGNTALFFPPPRDQPEIYRLLLAAGGDPAATNRVGHTPLVTLARLGYTESVRVLLQAGAPAGHVPADGRSALAMALLHRRLETASVLAEAGAELNPRLRRGGHLLYLLAERGEAEGVAFLLRQGVAPDLPASGAVSHPGETPLLAAARGGHLEVARHLIAAGAFIEATGAEGFTPLQQAARGNHPEMAELLLRHGARVEGRGREETRSPPLLLAAQAGSTAAARVLLEAGAEPDGGNRSRITPLMQAAYHGDEELARFLLNHGADVHALSAQGHPPLLFAVVRHHPTVVDLLLAAGASPNLTASIAGFGQVTPLLLAAGRGHLEVTRSLLSHGARVNEAGEAKGFGQVTPLLLASRKGLEPIVRELLAAGADPAWADAEGKTAVDWARQEGHAEISSLFTNGS